MIAVEVNNCLKNFKKITKNFNRFKKKCKIILKSKEVLFRDFIFYLMMNYCRFYHKLEILMQYRHI